VEQKGFQVKVLAFVAGRKKLIYLQRRFLMNYVVYSPARTIWTRNILETTSGTSTHISHSPALMLLLTDGLPLLLVI